MFLSHPSPLAPISTKPSGSFHSRDVIFWMVRLPPSSRAPPSPTRPKRIIILLPDYQKFLARAFGWILLRRAYAWCVTFVFDFQSQSWFLTFILTIFLLLNISGLQCFNIQTISYYKKWLIFVIFKRCKQIKVTPAFPLYLPPVWTRLTISPATNSCRGSCNGKWYAISPLSDWNLPTWSLPIKAFLRTLRWLTTTELNTTSNTSKAIQKKRKKFWQKYSFSTLCGISFSKKKFEFVRKSQNLRTFALQNSTFNIQHNLKAIHNW